jgi:hypothetical protein
MERGEQVMIRRALISVLAAAVALPRLAGAQDYQTGESDYNAPEAQAGAPTETAKPEASPSLNDFQSGLSPYGDWVDSPNYGRVWRPHVAADWRPYYYGHWTWTDDGWFWASDEPFGWATYHYGRWAYDPTLGWIWVPGYQWAPAWVSWRVGDDAIGWAPLFPGFSVFVAPSPEFFFAWTFVPAVRFVGFPVFRFAFAHAFVPRFFHFTHPALPRTVWQGNRTPAWGGPPHRFVEQRVGHPIASARIAPAWGHPGRASRPMVAGRLGPSRGAMPAPRANGFHGGPAPMSRGGGFHGGPMPRGGGFHGGSMPRGGGGGGFHSGHR